ncbi:2-succinyl-6-hydroxy-2,4-cyclohexadiene-1-carboxylate synthase [Bacillus litorisediminis]|uniref:2-succinyl-6-hydroxy-2, 4-cyclohexadiene-1-carboxylate synthase n=1 Tax=Bacillus litorisediminis TaxID=2922713 RepID=UPI001FABB12F|nr:2-succinyl-6-hydroxy-2,4-cyclohexadiene-1-carboxylate synthase [Bacillus litorisediminis]
MYEESIYVKIRGVQYHLKISGSGAPLWLLHGFTGSSKTWDELASLLSPYRTIVAIDLLGHGKTESPSSADRYTMNEQVEDLNQIRKQLSFDSIELLGYSMGGRVALSYTILKKPYVKKLILESSSPGLISEAERIERQENDFSLALKIKNEGLQSFVDYWANIPLFATQKLLPDSVQEKIRHERLLQNPIGLANSLIGLGTGSQPSWWNRLHEIDIPILFITGQKDQKFLKIAEQMKKRIPHASHINVFNAGHAIHVELPQNFGKIVKEFVLHT